MIRWPLREALRGYRRRVHAMQLEEYRHRVICYHLILPYVKKNAQIKAPAVPPFMRKKPRGNP